MSTESEAPNRALDWLITGGCGFIGTNLCRVLRRDRPADRIRILDDFSTGSADALRRAVADAEVTETPTWGPRPEILVGDVRDPIAAMAAAQGADVIVHLAANTGVPASIANPRKDCDTNVLGTLTMLDAARHQDVPSFIFASSGAPAGACTPPIDEEIVPKPISPYGASKLAGEGYCSAYHGSFGLATVALRFSNVYGPFSGHKGSVVAAFIRNALAGEPLTVFGDGGQTRDFIHVDDLVRAIIAVATTRSTVGGEVFQVATGTETRISDLVEMVRSALEAEGVTGSEVEHAPPRAGDMLHNYSDISKIRARLGWSPVIELREGIVTTVRHAVARVPSRSP
ncbi:MAG TPA: NAD-dependent epimerase/dehydratase family protein [Longimicrobiales bacterium]|nr:NAD-dependent epimerase/dehydratase family protein [Longimicrobiales bacterium]